jgi:hypothetical protein
MIVLPMPARSRLATALLVLAVVGCQAAPATSPASPSPAIERTPAPTAAAPTPTPASAAALAVIDGLRALAADQGRTYRVKFRGDSRHTTDILDVRGTLDVAGEDAAITSSFVFPRQGTARTDYRRKGTDDWARFDRGKWRTLKGIGAAEVVDPLAGAREGGRLQYLGPVEGATDRYQVELDGMVLHPVLIPAVNLTDEDTVSARLRLVTDAAGRPISGTWTFRGTGRVSRQLQAVEIDLDLTFSKVGEKIKITAP